MAYPASTTSNKDLFSTTEFEEWSDCGSLLPEEDAFINRHLRPHRNTLDAGTGGGRIVFQLAKRGFSNLAAYDYVPEHIEKARLSDPSGRIQFKVQNAEALGYQDDTFEQVVYFQQLLSFFEGEESRRRAVREVFRVLKPGGIGVFSVLNFEARKQSFNGRIFLAYLGLVRGLGFGSLRSSCELPWLRRGGHFNWSALLDHGPFAHWFLGQEIEDLFAENGLSVVDIGYPGTIQRNQRYRHFSEIPRDDRSGMLYLAVMKPQITSN